MDRRPSATRRTGGGIKTAALVLRQMGRMVMALALAGAVYAGFNYLVDPSILPIRVVRIEGQLKHLRRAQLQDAIGVRLTGSFFSLNLSAIEQALGRLPWVYSVSVRRQWPDTVVVHVAEQVPVVRWGEHAVLNSQGGLFRPAQDEIPQGLPMVHGPDGHERGLLERFRTINQQAKAAGASVKSFFEDERRAWRLELENGIEVSVGRRARELRVVRFFDIYPRLFARQASRIQRIDLRYANGMAVAWRDGMGEAVSAPRGD